MEDNKDIKVVEKAIGVDDIKELTPLESENKKLKDELKILTDKSQEKILIKENDELKSKIAELKGLFSSDVTEKTEKVEITQIEKKEDEIDENWVPKSYRGSDK